MKNSRLSIILILCLSLATIVAHAQVELPSLFKNNMVLQQQFEAPVWGWAEPGTKVVIKPGWTDQKVSVITDKDGKWTTKVSTPVAGGPYTLGINEHTIENVMIGEVWICSGQSNMQWALTQSEKWQEELKYANEPDIRLFYVARENSDTPNKHVYGKWVECDSTTAKTFSAVAYYFGKELYRNLQIPIGLIHVSWGGSSAEAWINKQVLASSANGQYYLGTYERDIRNASPGALPRNHRSPSSLYNGMLKPLIPFGIKGAIWYQGESNRPRPDIYDDIMEMLIANWRDEWGQGDFPFYFVQIAPYIYSDYDMGAFLRDAQRKTLRVPNTGMAVTMDIGNPRNIHPTNKVEVGRRLALWAMAKDYGQSKLVYSGPLFKSVEFKGDKAIVSFDHTGGGLMSVGKPVTHFEIAGSDRKFYSAEAVIKGNKVIVNSVFVPEPLAVRFAFHNTDEPNLFNKEGLPASSFRTDDWPINLSLSGMDLAYLVKKETQRSWEAYKKYAWGSDVLLPLSKSSKNWYDEPLYISPIDAYSTLKVMGLEKEAKEIEEYVINEIDFDKNIDVKIFEVNIRVLGGLLAMYQYSGREEILAKAEDFGKRMLPAFNSPTGIPYYWVNLKTGEVKGEEVNVAEAGSYTMEMGVLSYYTKNPVFYQAAKRATKAVFDRRSKIDLVGESINVETGEWTNTNSHICAGIDSYYEYMYKTWMLFKDVEIKKMWDISIDAINKRIPEIKDSLLWYGRVDMNSGEKTSSVVTLYDAFFPAILAVSGDVKRAKELQNTWEWLWNKYGLEPMIYDYEKHVPNYAVYDLNPEIIESAYYLYRITGDRKYYNMGVKFYQDIVKYCKNDVAFSAIEDVQTMEKRDYLATYFFAETMKYFYLLFSDDEDFGFDHHVFSTEAHPFDKRTFFSSEIKLRLGLD